MCVYCGTSRSCRALELCGVCVTSRCCRALRLCALCVASRNCRALRLCVLLVCVASRDCRALELCGEHPGRREEPRAQEGRTWRSAGFRTAAFNRHVTERLC